MADTSFVDGGITQANRIVAAWLNTVNNMTYQGKNPIFVTSSGAANAYTITLPASLLTALSDGQTLAFKANHTNTGAATLTVVGASSIGPTAIKVAGAALGANQIISGAAVFVTYFSGAWNIVATSTGSVGAGTFTNINVQGDTVLGDSVTGGNTTVNLLTGGQTFTVNTIQGETFQITAEGDIISTIVAGHTFTFTGGGTVTFDGVAVDMSNALSVDYLNGSILLEDLAPEVINLILAAGATGNNTITSGNGRLSFQTGTRVMTSDVVAATSHWYVASLVQVNDGTDNFVATEVPGGQLTQTAADTTKSPTAAAAGKNYDIFAWSDSGTLRATRGPVWTSDTDRGTGAGTSELQLIGSTYVNKVAITNGPGAKQGTYLGSIMTDAGAGTYTWKLGTGAANGGQAWLGVWNVSNRSFTGTAVQDTTASWTVSAAGVTVSAMNASNTWRCTMIAGLNDANVQVDLLSQAFPPATGSAAGVAIGLDSTSTIVARSNTTSGGNGNATTLGNFPVNAKWNGFVGLGKHFIQALQGTNLASGTATFYGLYSSGIYQSSMYTYSQQ